MAAAVAADPIDQAHIIALSITDAFTDHEAFKWLLNNIGINPPERIHLYQDGFNTMADLVNHFNYDIKGFKSYLENLNKTFAAARAQIRLYYTPRMIRRLCGIQYYFNHAFNTFHTILDVAFVNGDSADVMADEYEAHSKPSDDDDDKDVDLVIPKLEGHNNWINYRDAMITKISYITGRRGISLQYVIDPTPRTLTRLNQNRVEIDDLSLEDPSKFTIEATHFGPQFKQDNKDVWKILKASLINTHPYPHISKFDTVCDGRKAWQALQAFYEGEDFMQRLKDQAFTTLNNTFYRGETKNFNFDKYVNKHKQAHKQLQDAGYNNGLGLDEDTKIQHFKSGIKAEANLEYAITTIRSNTTRYDDFTKIVAFFRGEIDAQQIRKGQLKSGNSINVSKVTQNKSGRKNNTTNQNKNTKSSVVDGKTVYAKRYKPQEWKALSPKQREAVVNLHKEAKAASGGEKSKPPAYIKALRQEFQDDLKSIGDAIIAGVKAASAENEDGTVVTNSTAGTKRKAESGSVGDFIARNRRPTSSTS